MKVCKFGGSSLADAAQVNKVIDIVLADPARRIVVVSAPGKRHSGDTKVTDLLIALAETALKGDNTDREFGEVAERYASMADALKLGDGIVKLIEDDLHGRLAQAKSLAPEEFMDLMKAAGEDNNAKLVAAAFEARGRKARYASPKDTGMVLKGSFGDATATARWPPSRAAAPTSPAPSWRRRSAPTSTRTSPTSTRSTPATPGSWRR